MFSLNYFRLSAFRARSLGFLSQNLERDLILYSWNFLLLFDWQDLHKKTVEKGMYDEKGSGGGYKFPRPSFPLLWSREISFLLFCQSIRYDFELHYDEKDTQIYKGSYIIFFTSFQFEA